MTRFNGYLRTAGKRHALVTELSEMRAERAPCRNVVGAYDSDIGQRAVGSHRHHRYARVDGSVHQRLVATMALRDDQPVDSPLVNPLERDRWVVRIPQLETKKHQAGVARLKFLLHTGQQLREPGILNGIDHDTDATFETE